MSKLTLHDKCDRCIQPAYVKVTDPVGTALHFCGHHARKHLDHIPDTWKLYPELARLEAEHGPGRVRPEVHA